MRARSRATPSSERVRCLPPLSAFAIASLLRRMMDGVSSLMRPWYAIAWLTRGAVSASIHRMSAGATKCHVGRSTCVRRMSSR